METLLIGAVIVLVIILIVFGYVIKELSKELKEAEELTVELNEDFTNERNKYKRKCYVLRELNKKIETIGDNMLFETKKVTAAKLLNLIK